MRSLGQTPTEAEVKAIMKKIDVNNDGSIDFDEFVSLMSARSKASSNPPDDEVDLREAFQFFDKDGNGAINMEELRLVMRNIGIYLTDEELELMMKEADEDGNGVIDFQGKGSTSTLTPFSGSQSTMICRVSPCNFTPSNTCSGKLITPFGPLSMTDLVFRVCSLDPTPAFAFEFPCHDHEVYHYPFEI
jgi:hypothetical protein